jgi:hypothetical protein
MAATVSDFMLERLSESSVGRTYGYPGDGINGIAGAHEEVAAVIRSERRRS